MEKIGRILSNKRIELTITKRDSGVEIVLRGLAVKEYAEMGKRILFGFNEEEANRFYLVFTEDIEGYKMSKRAVADATTYQILPWRKEIVEKLSAMGIENGSLEGFRYNSSTFYVDVPKQRAEAQHEEQIELRLVKPHSTPIASDGSVIISKEYYREDRHYASRTFTITCEEISNHARKGGLIKVYLGVEGSKRRVIGFQLAEPDCKNAYSPTVQNKSGNYYIKVANKEILDYIKDLGRTQLSLNKVSKNFYIAEF